MQQNKITEGHIGKQLLAFFFPIWLGTFFQQLYNTVDAVVVGNFVGKEALAAVGGPTGVITNLLVGFFVGLSSGATVIISQYYGAHQTEKTSRAVHTAMALALSAGVVMTGLGLLTGGWILRAMGTNDEVMPYGITYLNIYFLGMVFNLVYNVGSGILRAVGDSRRPLYFLIVCSLTNAVLDIVFVAVLHMGVGGAALATIISEAVSAVLVIVSLQRAQAAYRLVLRKIRLHLDMLRDIVRIGLPAGLQSVLYTVSNMVIQASVNSFGTDIMAAWAAYGKIDGLFWMTVSSFGIAITTFVGQNFGAGKYDRCKKSVHVCIAMCMGVTVVLSGLLLLFGPYLYRMFTGDEAVVALGVHMMNFLVPFYFTYVCIEILSGAVRGAGDAFIPMLMTCVGVCLLRVLWIAFAVPAWPDIITTCLSYPITWTVTSIMFIVYYRHGGWLRRGIAKRSAQLAEHVQ